MLKREGKPLVFRLALLVYMRVKLFISRSIPICETAI